MAVGVQVWSQTPANNATADSNINFAEGQAPSSVNDSCRSLMASVARWNNDNKGTLVTSGTSAAFTVVTNQVESALTAGFTIAVQFHISNDASATLTADGLTAKPLRVYPGVALAGSEMGGGSVHKFTYSTTGTGEWIRQSPPAFTIIKNSLSGDVSLSNIANYFDGPSAAQGTTGLWYVSGTVTCLDTAGAAQFHGKLWDGITVVDSAAISSNGGSAPICLSLSGTISNPAANMRISVKDVTAATGLIKFNLTGNSLDSSVTAVRIG